MCVFHKTKSFTCALENFSSQLGQKCCKTLKYRHPEVALRCIKCYVYSVVSNPDDDNGEQIRQNASQTVEPRMTRVHRDLMPHITDVQCSKLWYDSSRLLLVNTHHKARPRAKLIYGKPVWSTTVGSTPPAASCMPCC